MNLIERAKAPTPKFFITLRNIGLLISGIGASILSSGAALPAVIIKIAGFMLAGGLAASGVSQTVTKEEEPLKRSNDGAVAYQLQR
jgi:hypothetical protein